MENILTVVYIFCKTVEELSKLSTYQLASVLPQVNKFSKKLSSLTGIWVKIGINHIHNQYCEMTTNLLYFSLAFKWQKVCLIWFSHWLELCNLQFVLPGSSFIPGSALSLAVDTQVSLESMLLYYNNFGIHVVPQQLYNNFKIHPSLSRFRF